MVGQITLVMAFWASHGTMPICAPWGHVPGEDGCVLAVATVHVVSCLLSGHLSAPEVPFILSISKSHLPRSLCGRGCSTQLIGRLWMLVPTAGLTMGEPMHCWYPLILEGL